MGRLLFQYSCNQCMDFETLHQFTIKLLLLFQNSLKIRLHNIQHRQKHVSSFECYNYFHSHQKSATCLLVMSTYPHVSLMSVFLIVSTICDWLIPRYCIMIGIIHCPLKACLHCRRAYTAADPQNHNTL